MSTKIQMATECTWYKKHQVYFHNFPLKLWWPKSWLVCKKITILELTWVSVFSLSSGNSLLWVSNDEVYTTDNLLAKQYKLFDNHFPNAKVPLPVIYDNYLLKNCCMFIYFRSIFKCQFWLLLGWDEFSCYYVWAVPCVCTWCTRIFEQQRYYYFHFIRKKNYLLRKLLLTNQS